MSNTKNDIPIADLHCDTAQLLAVGRRLDGTETMVNLAALEAGGIGLQVFACYVPPSIPRGLGFPMAERMLDRFEREVERLSDHIAICRNTQEIDAAREKNKVAAILAVENGNAIENDLKKLDLLHKRGVRLMTLVHSQSNDWVISCTDKNPRFDGLTGFGAEVIAAMDELGMIIDISHAHDRVVEKALVLSRKPIIASHSCIHSICPVPRNLKDNLIKGLAHKGGLVGVNIYPAFLDLEYWREMEKTGGDLFEELDKAEREAGPDLKKLVESFARFAEKIRVIMAGRRVPIERYMEHILAIQDLAGPEAVAFGSDFDGVPDLPAGICDCRGLRLVSDRLLEKGIGRAEVERLCWSNFLRVFKAVCG